MPDGVWLVELAPVTDPAEVPSAVLAALGLREQALLYPRGALGAPADEQADALGRLLAALAGQRALLVRVESAARIRMGRVLDSGAAGIMLPRLDAVDEVAEAIRHLRYPPAGDRGVATYNRSCRFGLDPGALDRANDEILGIVQIESAAAVTAEFGRART